MTIGKLQLRQVVRQSDDGEHQTPIVTTRRDLPAIEVAHRMFERWRQENFFKYLREEFALDALAEYGVDLADAAREVPNPAWKRISAELTDAREELRDLQADYGSAALLNPESRRPTMRGFKIAHGKTGQRMRATLRQIAALEARRSQIPKRIPVGQVVDGPVVKLSPERKLLTNLLKMVAYQAESDLVQMIAGHYKRAEDEGRTLVQTILTAPAHLDVGGGELRVRVLPLSSAHRTRALATLCAELDALACRFPGTRTRVRYAVAGEADG